MTAIAATMTAVAALVVAVWDNVQTRNFNRVSVQPHLVLEFNKHQGDEGDSGRLLLRNEGIGPALVRTVTIGYVAEDGAARRFESWNAAREVLHGGSLIVTGYTDLSEASVLGVERTIDLLVVRVEDDERPVGDPVQDMIDRLSVTVAYTSVWGDAYETSWPSSPG